MDPVIKRQSAFARVWATVVACLLLLQMALAGVAVAAADSGRGASFGVVCASPSAAEVDGRPAVPHGDHRRGLCCILHCGALAAPPKPLLPLVLTFPAEAVALQPTTESPAPRVNPKRAPQSPRAPPAQG